MKFGTGLPGIAGNDIGVIRDLAQRLDGSGMDYVTLSGHVLSMPAERYPDRPRDTVAGPFHDPFVLFAYLASVTNHLEFMTSILILPLYPTALLAKQASELAFVSHGRFNLGVGISWNPSEYAALGQDLRTRGRRLEEQIQALRMFWSQPYVTFDGRWHQYEAIGLNRSHGNEIPIWIGCSPEEPLLRRVAKLADGWMPMGSPVEALPRLQQFLREEGRDPATFRVSSRLVAGQEGPDSWIESAERLRDIGVTHLSLGAPAGESDPIGRILQAREVLDRALGSS